MANEVVQLGIALELVQVRTGHSVRKKTARGVLVDGTEEAIVKEMGEAFVNLTSTRGYAIRKRCEEVKTMVVEDMERGPSYRNMMALGDL